MPKAKVTRDYTDRLTMLLVEKGKIVDLSDERYEELIGKRKVISMEDAGLTEDGKPLPVADSRPVITDPGLGDKKDANIGTGDNKYQQQAPPAGNTNVPPVTTPPAGFTPPPPPPNTNTGNK